MAIHSNIRPELFGGSGGSLQRKRNERMSWAVHAESLIMLIYMHYVHSRMVHRQEVCESLLRSFQN